MCKILRRKINGFKFYPVSVLNAEEEVDGVRKLDFIIFSFLFRDFLGHEFDGVF